MKQLLNGYSHFIIHTLPKERATATGVFAYIDICYGSEADAIANIPWRKVEGQMTFSSPRTAIASATGKEVKPVFKGKFNEEICALCTQKIFQVRKQMGAVRAGHTYRVDDTGVTDITSAK